MVSRYRQTEPTPERLLLWSLLDELEAKARTEAGPLEEDEAHTTHGVLQSPARAPAPVVIVCLKRSVLVGLPRNDGRAEIYGHNPGREWELVHAAFPCPVGEGLAEVLFGLAQKHWHNGGRL